MLIESNAHINCPIKDSFLIAIYYPIASVKRNLIPHEENSTH